MSSYLSYDSSADSPADSSATRPQKVVTLVEEPETITPQPTEDDDNRTLVDSSPKRHRASISGKKMTGRPPISHSASSTSLVQNFSYLNLHSSEPNETVGESQPPDLKSLLSQVVEWLHEEKSKHYKSRLNQHHAAKQSDVEGDLTEKQANTPSSSQHNPELALEKLEQILAGFSASAKASLPKITQKTSPTMSRKGSIAKKFKRGAIVPVSSDTEFFGDDILVPNVEADLDNSKTMAFTGGAADSDTSEKAKSKDLEHWITFKQEIMRLTHTLKLKGWRRIPIEKGAEIEVTRLSGALTNAVYVVKSPKNVFDQTTPGSSAPRLKKQPMQLLLRIYGPQVEHLIDRDDELAILKRLARKHIGPRLLGTFHNGRFEEFLHAKTLEAEDLRLSDTSKQIAKRMRELHDGIELLEKELDAGPAIFLNWDKCVDRCEKVITFLDKQVHQQESEQSKISKDRYTRRGLICGVEWPVFRKTYEKYRKQLIAECGGKAGIKKKLVFAHNDTQYGNLMRLQPSGESPLLQPANQHRQLVVIDFEYAGQNTAGLEFANHFTEWCYNYHHPELSYACNTNAYPTPQEQYRFVRSYVMHRPQFNPAASATPKMDGREKTTISDFMLDARTPAGATTIDYDAEERAREKAMEEDIQRLLHETRLWRIANSAHWVAWGIVQAKVPELNEPEKKSRTAALIEKVRGNLHPHSDPLDEEEMQLKEASHRDRPEGREKEEEHAEGEEEEHEEFDYLAYAQERAMFFWGDCLQMGLIKEDDLPESVKAKIKIVKY